MPRSHWKSTNDMKDQARIPSPKPTSPLEMFAHECYLNTPRIEKLKKNHKFRGFKEDPKKLNEIKGEKT